MRLKGSSPSAVPVLSYMGSPEGSIIGGIPGRAATVTVGSTTTGSAGSSASVVNSGDYSAAVFDFTVPRGDTGATGATGPTGPIGLTGNAATATVGSTSTGLPGSSAVVSNSGTVNAAVLNFTVPRGDVGPQGAPGTPGSVTVAGLGDATTVGRMVCKTAQGGLSAEDTSNTWAKLATLTLLAVNHDIQLILNVSGCVLDSHHSAVISVYARQSVGNSPIVDVQMLSKANITGSSTQVMNADAFKIISGGLGTAPELWIKKSSQYTTFTVWEVSRAMTTNSSVTYHNNAPWQSAEPVGAVNNVRTNGVTAYGQPVVTTTATQTLTGKTLTNPVTEAIRDSAGNAWTSVSGSFAYISPFSRSSFEVSGQASSVNAIRVQGNTTGNPPQVSATGSDTNVSLNLVSKGSGTVNANGIPVATTTGAQTITNKTISGSSNTITSLPASATPNAARLVRSTGSTVIGQWTRVLTFAAPAAAYFRYHAMFSISCFARGGAIIDVDMGTLAADQVNGSIQILSRAFGSIVNDDSFKIINNGYGQPFELWFKPSGGGSVAFFYEISKISEQNVTFDTSSTFTATEPVGTVLNAVSAGGVVVDGIPVVTTTGTQTLTGKTLTSPVLNSPSIGGGLRDQIHNAISLNFNPANANPVNYFEIRSSTSSPQLRVMGSSANLDLQLYSKGTGQVRVCCDNSAGTPTILAENGTSTANLDLRSAASGTVQANGIPVVTTTGAQALTNKTLTSPTLTSPRVNLILDSNGFTNTAIRASTGTPVNHIMLSNRPAGGAPYVSADGTDTNINLDLISKGTGNVLINGNLVPNAVAVPATTTSTGKIGQMAWDASFFYVCVNNNTWRRIALETW